MGSRRLAQEIVSLGLCFLPRLRNMARALVLGLVVALVSAETVHDCVEAKCRGCGGEQCQLCREDKSTISACVSSCMDTICRGCGGEQCQLCREDANTLSSCCSGTEGIDICKAESKDPCDGLYGAAGLQCAWEQDAKSCIETKCHGCGGEQCQLCREDANTIAGCCDDHYHSVDPPKMCIDSKEEAVNSCFDSKCQGCGGEQCQLCREDAKSECCTGAMRTPACEAEVVPKDPCDGLYGAAGLQCAWEQDAKSCIETKCHGCGGEQCQLCREDANTIAGCCDDHYHSVDPPKMCIDSKEEAVNSCFDSKCHGCGGEQCQLCREDAKSECCTGAMRTPSCESSRAVLP